MSYNIHLPTPQPHTAAYEGIDILSGMPIRVDIADDLVSRVQPLSPGTKPQDGKDVKALPYLCPGFIDLQVNGYAGIDYSSPGLDTPSIEKIIRAIGSSGTTRHLATIITGARERITEGCGAIAKARKESAFARTAITGIHVEGPYISPLDGPRGAHDKKHVRNPDFEEFKEWQEAAEGLIRIVTLAPETEGAIEFIEKITTLGVVASIGHTSATQERIRDAVAAGARLSTHLGNGSNATMPRLRNYIWNQLAEDRLSASIIGDGFHLPDDVLKVFSRAKGMERLILVSDVAFLAGSPPGPRSWGDISVEVHPDGHISLLGTEFLAGAGHLLDRCIARFAKATGMSLPQTVALCTANPARLLGLPKESLKFTMGTPACLTMFRPAQSGEEALTVETCVINGEVVYGR
ncbi:MAG: hypothetical protein FD137_1090 [Spirochaetes bacterium]|nr:MAG: hypothetical protein FD137_1090 [Spirochaetota bacterium]